MGVSSHIILYSINLKLKSVQMICLITVQVHLPVRFSFPINKFLIRSWSVNTIFMIFHHDPISSAQYSLI